MKSETECLIDNEFSYSSNVILSKGITHDIFYGNIIKDNSQCAIKTEEISTSSPQLEHEYNMLSALHDKKCSNIPRVYKYSKKGSKSLLIMELLGHSIDKIFSLLSQKRQNVNLFGELNINKWQGQQNIQFIVEDVLIGD